MTNTSAIGIHMGEILLPAPHVNLQKWAVIACDQFTSQPEYWQQVASLVGSAPSTYHMILPEIFLNTPAENDRVRGTQAAMQDYLSQGLLLPQEDLILVERSVDGKTRHGLMMALDLEHYDFRKGSQSLIRATEGTIIERLPPRIRIREGATLEIPHILVLIDDPQQTVIEPLFASAALQPLYDTDLMLGSGHLRGSRIKDAAVVDQMVQALQALADPQRFCARYDVGQEKGVLLFAVGDGNHSLATAKSIWEKNKAQIGMQHPTRYALVEVENVHDSGLDFEPIHRVLFDVQADWQSALRAFFGEQAAIQPVADSQTMIQTVNQQPTHGQTFGVVSHQGHFVVTIPRPPANLAVGTLQGFLDAWLAQGGAGHIDYVHGAAVVCRLGAEPGSLGFYLPKMQKRDLFQTVILDGALPRKTFSMGEAHEKRFYMECRRIAF